MSLQLEVKIGIKLKTFAQKLLKHLTGYLALKDGLLIHRRSKVVIVQDRSQVSRMIVIFSLSPSFFLFFSFFLLFSFLFLFFFFTNILSTSTNYEPSSAPGLCWWTFLKYKIGQTKCFLKNTIDCEMFFKKYYEAKIFFKTIL